MTDVKVPPESGRQWQRIPGCHVTLRQASLDRWSPWIASTWAARSNGMPHRMTVLPTSPCGAG